MVDQAEAEYEEQLVALQLQAGVPIRGRNPRRTISFITGERRKSCISILTEQHFDLFGQTAHGHPTGERHPGPGGGRAEDHCYLLHRINPQGSPGHGPPFKILKLI